MQPGHLHGVFISSYSKARNKEHPSFLLFSGFPVPGHFRPAGLPASLLPLCDMQLSAAPVPGASHQPCLVGTQHPSQACSLGPASPQGWGTRWLSGPAPGAQGMCSKHTGKTRQFPLPDTAFVQKLGKLGVPKGVFPTEQLILFQP